MGRGRRKNAPENPSFGRAIRWMREELDLSQVQLAKRVHVSQSALSRYESDEAEPAVSMLPRFSDALRTSVWTLLTLLGIDPGEPQTPREWQALAAEEVAQRQAEERERRLAELERFQNEHRQARAESGDHGHTNVNKTGHAYSYLAIANG